VVVVHLADFFDVVVKAGDFEFVRVENGAGFFAGPGEVVAVIV
jgi:hypothetical protein